MTEYYPVLGAEMTVQESPRERVRQTELIRGAEAIADDILQDFLRTHIDDKLGTKLTLSEMDKRSDTVLYHGYRLSLSEIAGCIRARANEALLTDKHIEQGHLYDAEKKTGIKAYDNWLRNETEKKLGVEAYDIWLREHASEIASDFGSILTEENGEFEQIEDMQQAA